MTATPWPPLHAYALAHPCPACQAEPGAPCKAPRKNARLDRTDEQHRQAGHPAPEHDPVNRIHAVRQDAGARHYRRDVGNAPWPEDRPPGQRYNSLPDTTVPAAT